MADELTFGQMMLADILPPDLYQPGQVINKKRLSEIMGQIAERDPESYGETVYKLQRLGLKTGESMGGASFGLDDLQPGPEIKRKQAEIGERVRDVLDSTRDPRLRREKIVEILRDASGKLPEAVYQDGKTRGNRFTLQLEGAGRGNKGSLASMLVGDMMVQDSSGPIPIPINRGYTQGLTPGQYHATSYGGRSSIVTTKLAVGSSGYLCFTGDVEVRMADGSARPIKNVEPGEWVIGANQQGQTFPVRVLHRWENGEQPVTRYTARRGASRRDHMEFTATPGHEVLARVDAYYKSRFPVSQASVVKGTRVKVQLGNCRKLKHRLELSGPSIAWAGQHQEDLAWLIGYVIGDGCLSGHSTNFSTADGLVSDYIEKLLSPQGFTAKPKNDRPGNVEFTITDDQPRRRDVATVADPARRLRHRLRQRLQDLGLLRKKAHQKTIHKDVWTWNKQSICELLSGLIEADGCFVATGVSTVSMRFSVTSRDLTYALKDLLSVVLGVHSTSVKRHEPTVVPRKDWYKVPYEVQANHPMWELSVTGYENIIRILEQLPARGSKFHRARELFAAKEYSSRYTATARIIDESPAGHQAVYDLAVDHPDHLYVLANGLVVSNSKLLQQAAHRLVVTDEEDPEPIGEHRGYLVDADDSENIGALLASPVGPFERNTPITPAMLGELAKHAKGKQGKILIRSPIASSSLDGGLFGRDVGVREFGRLARRGEHVGLPASQAIGEQVTQASLGAKHSAGKAGDVSATPGLSGFALVERLVNPPKDGRGLAIHAQVDGKVLGIREAPQGGQYVKVGEQEHYVPGGFRPGVELGDRVEAGDVLTNGIPDPAEVVRLKGIGEGRRYFVESLRRGLNEAKFPVERRNLELLSRGLIDRVKVDREFADFTPGSLVSYSRVERLYRPRKEAQRLSAEQAEGQYLESPVMHYSIGTRVTPSVIRTLRLGDVREVLAHGEPPPFTATPVRGADILQSDEDFMTQFMGSHIKKGLTQAVQFGGESDEESTSFVPVRASAVNLGRTKLTASQPGV